ncbi:aldo/keto reductase [Castellaniella sp.]|uniref:aldo/keto reductase n=1 Tax=Castellaniella sp. TaxID=1955812 RepID=UPI00355D9158
MQYRALGRSGLTIAPMVLGGNALGWTADEATSFSLLDAFVDAGLNAVDTANSYSAWVDGNQGGESETIIGHWLQQQPSRRERIVLITKVGSKFPGEPGGLSARSITQAVENSLRRLRTDYIDLYLSHWHDPDTPYADTLATYQRLIDAGKVRAIGASNLDAAQLAEALQVASDRGLPRYEVLQPEYNLYDREKFEGPLAELTRREGLGVITYYSLASGFLSGKYRVQADLARGPRGVKAANYLNERGLRILAALDQVAGDTGASQAEIALAWLIGQDAVTAPIASATSLAQLHSLVRATQIELTAAQRAVLDQASQ